MSLRSDLASLDARFRKRQVVMQAGLGLAVRKTFAAIPPADVLADGTAPSVDQWMDRATVLTEAVRTRSAREARDHYDAIRSLTTPGAPRVVHPDPPPVDIAALRTSLFVTGPVRARKAFADQPKAPDALDPESADAKRLEIIRTGSARKIMEQAGSSAGAAAGRHGINGGREQMEATRHADVRAVGYVRVTGPRPCYFCAALASRGAVYDEDSFDESDARFIGPGTVKVHDSCSCGFRPVYSRRNEEMPEASQVFSRQWYDLSQDLGRSPSLSDWRKVYDGRAATV